MSELKKDTAAENTAEVKTEKEAVAEKADTKAEKKAKKDKPKKEKKSKGSLKAFLKSRKARHGSLAAAVVAIVIALVIVLNIVVSLLVDRFPNLVIDFTSDSSFALEDDTIDYVSHIDKAITITVLTTEEKFEASGNYYIQANKLLEKMESASNGKITLKYIDLSSNPAIAQQYTDADWTTSSNMMIVECGDQYRVLTIDDCFEYDESYYSYYGTYYVTASIVEQGVVTAILNVTTEDKVIVDMITGNQEQDSTGIKTLLTNNAYQVNEVSLATGDLDEDAKFAILYAPSVDLDEGAVEKLSKWLDNDGKYGRNLIFIPTENAVDTPNIDSLLDEWGMQVNQGYVYETSTDRLVSSSSPYIFTVNYTDYYTTGLKNPNIPVVTLYARGITITDTSVAYPLLTTSTSAGIYPVDADENWKAEDGLKNEELNIAAESVKSNTDNSSSKVIVYGSYSMFTSDIMSYNSFNNSGYFMNMMNTIADKDDAGITIEGKSMESAELGITDATTKNALFVVFVVIVPIGVLVTGIVMWMRRRNR